VTTDALVFDPSDPAYLANPYPMLRRLRDEAPVHWWERGHMWLLSRYADVEATLKDPRFSTDVRKWRHYQHQGGVPASILEIRERGLLAVGRDDHTRIRKVVAPSFSPRAAEQREALVQRVVDELLAELGEVDEIDLVGRLAEPLPIRVISQILGIPPEHDETFREWGQTLVKSVIPVLPLEQRIALAQRLPAGYELLARLVEERRAQPVDDLLSSLIHAQQEGERIDSAELLALVGLLVTAGSETTVHLVAFAVLELLRHPEVLARVRDDLELLPGVIEEVLRHDCFMALGVPRYALEDVEIRGQAIAKGDMLFLMLPAAMHDEAVWPDAERFDIDREPAPNLSFGRGPHFCLGAHLARLEARVVLRTLLTRFPAMELAGEPTYRPHPVIRHMTSLPVRLRPGAKV
jgi:cytochrome P450 enzyme